jgi:hypothetical protein
LTSASNALAQATASKLSTNYNGAWLVGSGGSTNITGGGTWTLNAGTWTYAPTGITTAVQSALDGKLNTNGVAQSSSNLVSGAQVGTLTITNLTTEGSQTMNGTANLAPNQTASSASSLMTRSLGDARWTDTIYFHLPTQVGDVTIQSPGSEPFLRSLRFGTNSGSAIWFVPTAQILSGKSNFVVTAWVSTEAAGSGKHGIRLTVYDYTQTTRGSAKNADQIVTLTSNAFVEVTWTNVFDLTKPLHDIRFTNAGTSNLTGSAYWFLNNVKLTFIQ